MTRCQPPFMLRQPVVTLYFLIAHACTIVEPCAQIGSSQISNSDIRLKQVINDTFSDVFSAQWESDCPTAQMSGAAMHQCLLLLKVLGNNSRYRSVLWNLMCLSYISSGAKTELLTGITLIKKKKALWVIQAPCSNWWKWSASTNDWRRMVSVIQHTWSRWRASHCWAPGGTGHRKFSVYRPHKQAVFPLLKQQQQNMSKKVREQMCF